jgi:hypothetical protein
MARSGTPLVSLQAAQAWRAEHLSPEGTYRAGVAAERRESSTAAPAAKPATEAHWRTRRARADALLREAELARLNGISLDRDATKAGWVRMLTTARARLLGIPATIAAQISSPAERLRIADILEREIFAALHELAGTNPDE